MIVNENTTLGELKKECLRQVKKTEDWNKTNKVKMGCADYCPIKCRDHKIGWYPGGMVFNNEQPKREEEKPTCGTCVHWVAGVGGDACINCHGESNYKAKE